jgi:IgGFc binding protein
MGHHAWTFSLRLGTCALVFALAAACTDSGSGGTPPPPADPCAPTALTGALGCEFFPTVTANVTEDVFPFGIAVVNSGAEAASVRIEGGALAATLELTVAPGGTEQRTLPWVSTLKGCASASDAGCGAIAPGSVVAVGGAYHVTSTRPVSVFQFSPIAGMAGGGANVISADATAVPPVHALGKLHFVASWPTLTGFPGETFPGFVAVTAVADGTQVTVTPTAAIPAGDLGALAARVPQTLTLNRGDVLELLAVANEASGPGGDLSGTVVESSAPVLVFGGHACAWVPVTAGYCDHLEEAIPPVAALGTEYVLVPPRVDALPDGKRRIVRVTGTEPDTTLVWSTFLVGAPGTLGRGQVAELETDAPLRLVASHPVLVAEYMEGYTRGGDEGDPSLAIALPVSRFRASYTVPVPMLGTSFADLVAPGGAAIRVNGGAPLQLTPIAGTAYALARVGLGGGSTYTLTGDQPFGVSVYATQAAASWWYAPCFGP